MPLNKENKANHAIHFIEGVSETVIVTGNEQDEPSLNAEWGSFCFI